MKSNLVFFLGIFAALGISWAGIVLGSNSQLGGLAPYYDESQATAYPEWFPGEAARGQLVYKDLGCAQCHTQQVRRPGFGSDQERGWGERQSVARDYIYQPFPQLGASRVGPDLTNLADRKPMAPTAEDLLEMLYTGSDGMPSYRFLFERRHVGVGAQPSDQKLLLTGAAAPAAGWEVVPTSRALALISYLLNSKTTYDYPEALPVVPPKAEGEAPAAKPAAPAPAVTSKSVPNAGAPAPAAAAPVAPGAAAPAPSGATPPAALPGGAPAAEAPAAATPAPSGAAAATPSPSAPVTPAHAAATTPVPAAAAAPSAPATPTPSATAAPSAPGGAK